MEEAAPFVREADGGLMVAAAGAAPPVDGGATMTATNSEGGPSAE